MANRKNRATRHLQSVGKPQMSVQEEVIMMMTQALTQQEMISISLMILTQAAEALSKEGLMQLKGKHPGGSYFIGVCTNTEKVQDYEKAWEGVRTPERPKCSICETEGMTDIYGVCGNCSEVA